MDEIEGEHQNLSGRAGISKLIELQKLVQYMRQSKLIDVITHRGWRPTFLPTLGTREQHHPNTVASNFFQR